MIIHTIRFWKITSLQPKKWITGEIIIKMNESTGLWSCPQLKLKQSKNTGYVRFRNKVLKAARREAIASIKVDRHKAVA